MASEEAASIRTRKFVILLSSILIFLGIAGKFYGLTDPWKTHDHYNYGGIWTTTYAECLKSTPLAISKGIPHILCWTASPEYYRAHPPTILFAMWGWTSLWGSAEWSYRLFILTFSTLNILLVFLIARLVKPQGPFPWLAAAFQSTTLAGLYFGTHLDFIGEFTVFFLLLTAYLALRRRMTSACLMGLVAGISSWPGYIVFGPLLIYGFLIQEGRKRTILFGSFGLILALATMMWLHQSLDIIEFLKTKLLHPGYVAPNNKGPLEPLYFLKNFITSQARLQSPVFFTFCLFELIRGDGRELFLGWKNKWRDLTPLHYAVILCGGTGILYALIGHEYVMVHVYLYLLALPGFSLLSARYVERILSGAFFNSSDLFWLTGIGLGATALYPFGIFKSNVLLDVTASTVLVSGTLTLLFLIWKHKTISARMMATLMVLGFTGNALETMNYRNEPDTQRSFCQKARAEFQRTGQPVRTSESRHFAKDFLYCRDIPVIYENEKASHL